MPPPLRRKILPQVFGKKDYLVNHELGGRRTDEVIKAALIEIEPAVIALALLIIVLRLGEQQPLGSGVEQVLLVVLQFPDIKTARDEVQGVVEEMRVPVFDKRVGALDGVVIEVEQGRAAGRQRQAP